MNAQENANGIKAALQIRVHLFLLVGITSLIQTVQWIKQTPAIISRHPSIHRIFSSLYFFSFVQFAQCKGIWKMFACGIRNPGLWNPEYSSRNPDPTNDCYPESKLQDIDSNPVPGIRNPRRGIQNSRPSRVSLHRGSSVNKYEGLFRNTGHLRWPDTSLLHTPSVAPCRSLNFFDSL